MSGSPPLFILIVKTRKTHPHRQPPHKFGPLPGRLRQSSLPCPQLSAGEIKFETATPRPGRDRGCRRSKTIHLSFGFLRVSVPPWCKGLVLRFLLNFSLAP